ncbi:hypothetical protein V8E54_013564 [Elaphomyces granulatus]
MAMQLPRPSSCLGIGGVMSTKGSDGDSNSSGLVSNPRSLDEAQGQAEPTKPFYRSPDPVLVTSSKLEKSPLKSGISPIGSHRAALQNSQFEQLPYQNLARQISSELFEASPFDSTRAVNDGPQTFTEVRFHSSKFMRSGGDPDIGPLQAYLDQLLA